MGILGDIFEGVQNHNAEVQEAYEEGKRMSAEELLDGTLRSKKTAYPVLAIREAIGNALIHQDFSISGTGPTVEVFDERIEIINANQGLN